MAVRRRWSDCISEFERRNLWEFCRVVEANFQHVVDCRAVVNNNYGD
jgi:hypothetical protein